MAMAPTAPRNIDDYIATFSPEVGAVLERIRQSIRAAVPMLRIL